MPRKAKLLKKASKGCHSISTMFQNRPSEVVDDVQQLEVEEELEAEGVVEENNSNMEGIQDEEIQSTSDVQCGAKTDKRSDEKQSVSDDQSKITSEPFPMQYRPSDKFDFPKTKAGGQERKCQSQWFQKFPWLHYNKKDDTVLCYTCMKNDRLNKANL